MSVDDATAITNLLYRYAELMDAADFEGAAELFRHAKITLAAGQPPVSADEVLDMWRRMVIVHPEGTLRTRHLVSNPIVEVTGATATCRSSYVVLQATEALPLQPIVVGRYHDRFERYGDGWRFTARDYSLVDLVGDVSDHLKGGMPPR